MSARAATTPLLGVELRTELDVVLARQRARQIAALLGFDVQDQTRVSTAVSEIARNVVEYAGEGRAAFALEEDDAGQLLGVQVSDRGPGIAELQRILDGDYVSRTGMGLGIVGARRLMDRFHVASEPGRGTTVLLAKRLPRGPLRVGARQVAQLVEQLTRTAAHPPVEEVRQQNQELVRMLDELRSRQDEVERLNRELEETNRGVLALYAELDERAEELRRASEHKTRFLSTMSHELRTPLGAIINVSRLLQDEVDGPLTTEQRRQVTFVREAAITLSEIVNDLLDIAKIEAGRTTLHLDDFTVGDLLGGLRGVFRPLATNPEVALVVEEPPPLPPMHSDEQRLAQILRNFVSNALKFTERGEVRLSVCAGADDTIAFAVSDTGIGIAPGDQERIFEEFAQVEHPLQRRVKGTGLGLPLTRRLAALLGGRIELRSAVGEGSTFTVIVPRRIEGGAHPVVGAGSAPGARGGEGAFGGRLAGEASRG